MVQSSPPAYKANTLSQEYELLSHLHSRASTNPLPIPIPSPIVPVTKFDSGTFSYFLLSRPSGVPFRRDTLPIHEHSSTDFHIGSFLRDLHTIDGEYFGRPGTPTNEQLYVWQEAFTLALEEVIDKAQELSGVLDSLPFEAIRSLLSRAIGSFVFDDVEWPSLVTIAADESDFLLSPTGELVCALATGLSHATWGDPLLEQLFMRPRHQLIAGYKNEPYTPHDAETEEDSQNPSSWGLTTFARQQNKMVWYQLYVALVAIVEEMESKSQETESNNITRSVEAVKSCVIKIQKSSLY
jgi:hypothetical protein